MSSEYTYVYDILPDISDPETHTHTETATIAAPAAVCVVFVFLDFSNSYWTMMVSVSIRCTKKKERGKKDCRLNTLAHHARKESRKMQEKKKRKIYI